MHHRVPSALFLLLSSIPLISHADDPALQLQLDPTFRRHPANPDGTAAFIRAQRVIAKRGDQLEATGNVELRQNGQVISAGHLVYEQTSQNLLADGSVRLEQSGMVVTGPILKLNLDTNLGELSQPSFVFDENRARGTADTMHIAGKKSYIFDDATFTTCPAGNDDWMLHMSHLDIDRATQVGVAHGTIIDFKGVPILYSPWMDFSLDGSRRSGFLGPTFGSTNTGGTELTLPYYFNIAPNLDDTFSPRDIQKRGMQLNNEFRYLEPDYKGLFHIEELSDKLTGTDRSYLQMNHTQNLGNGLGLTMNVSRVSDDAYFQDLASTVSATSQSTLSRDATLSYNTQQWSAAVLVQSFQTLQDPLAPIVPPYRELPKLTLYGHDTQAGANLSLATEYVDFHHDTLISAERLMINPSVSYPLSSNPGYFLTPKLSMNYTQYRMGDNNTSDLPDATRTLPIFSVDSGLQYERDVKFFQNGDYLQTLEPRLFYVYIPYRNQDQLPVFDTAQAPFTYAQAFSENRFVGDDRIGDANMATLAVTSRLIDNVDGIERLRIMLGERFSFISPQVNLVNPAATVYPPNTYLTPIDNSGRSDILLGLSGKINRALSVDSLLQYDPSFAQTDMYTVSTTYRPEPGKLLNVGYRLERGILHQADVSTQWPIYGHWEGVARLSYSLLDQHAVESLAGLEYNQACWTMRFVAQSITISTNSRSTGIFIQLELNNLMSLGSDPMDALRLSVPGYTKTNTQPAGQ